MNFRVANRGMRILGVRKFPARNLLGARADRARKPPQTRMPPFAAFRSTAWRYWRENGRHNLPWRMTSDPYKILVSEVMLQQTQVDRVMPKYKAFLKTFPTIQSLAKAPLIDVLKIWSGLGYNRRAKYLRDAAAQIVEKHNGRVPAVYSELVELPGVGDYTARAVRVFAFDEPDVLIETNIRTVFIHSLAKSDLGKNDTKFSDVQIFEVAEQVAKGQDPKEWHWALMDYGAYLKRSGVRNNHRSSHYAKQSKFEGSLRQVRGQILRDLMKGTTGRQGDQWTEALDSLVRDGLVIERQGKWLIV